MGRFPRSYISLEKSGFRGVFKKNYQSGDRLLLVLVRENHGFPSRLGLAISRKHTPRAVDRNRIKRLIRESFYQWQPFPVSLDVVVMNRFELKRPDNMQVRESLSRHWQCILDKINKV